MSRHRHRHRHRHRRRRRGSLVALVFLPGFFALAFLAGATGLAAQGGERLTFEEAVGVALENSPVYLRQVNLVRSSEHSERQSLGQMLPSLAAGVSFSGNTSRSKTAEDEWGRPISEVDYIQSTRSSTSQGLSGNVALFDMRSVRAYGAARARTDAQVAGVELQAALLRTQVGADYYEAVLRAGLVAVEERGLATARENLAAIRQLLRVAARQPTDVLGAELQVARAEQSLERARGAARKASLQLATRMGVPLDREYEPVSDFAPVFDPAALDLTGLLQRAAVRNPRLAQQAAVAVAASRSLSAARAARFPTLSGNYAWGRSASLPDYGAFNQLAPENQSWGFGLTVGLPLFNRFQTSAQVGQAEVEALNAAESLREARLELEREVRSAVIDLENAFTGVRLAERSAGIAREQLRQGQEQYRLNTIDYTALQRMVDQVSAAERDVLQARHGFTLALLTLEEKVGGEVGPAGSDG
jgi:outer membrane protein